VEVSVWPAVCLIAVWMFKTQVAKGIEAFMNQIEHLIELKAAGVLMKFKGRSIVKNKQPEKVDLAPLDIEDSGSA
jgi:hypothetical protein